MSLGAAGQARRGRAAPLTDQSDITRWLMPVEAAEAVISEARSGTAGGWGGHQSGRRWQGDGGGAPSATSAAGVTCTERKIGGG